MQKTTTVVCRVGRLIVQIGAMSINVFQFVSYWAEVRISSVVDMLMLAQVIWSCPVEVDALCASFAGLALHYAGFHQCAFTRR